MILCSPCNDTKCVRGYIEGLSARLMLRIVQLEERIRLEERVSQLSLGAVPSSRRTNLLMNQRARLYTGIPTDNVGDDPGLPLAVGEARELA